MTGWTRQRRLSFESGYYEFLNNCYIQSKDYGRISLGKNLYWGQKQFITTVFDALEQDKHDIYCLKSRQLGASTGSRALLMFLLGMADGLKGGIVFDTEPSKQEARSELVAMINDLPKAMAFPTITSDNRYGMTLSNGSKVSFFAAGTSKRKSSGTLGRSFGLSLSHASELCSYENEEGLEAYRNSLSDENPDRLYLWESTGRGFNQWYDMWKDARRDIDHCACLFLGWWSKDSQRIAKDQPDFERYGTQAPTDRELRRIREVRERYGFQIDPEQLAWVRRRMDPGAQQEGDAPVEYEGNVLRLAEQAWVEEDAFQYTGSVFFAPETLTEQANRFASKRFKTYMFTSGLEFVDTKVFPAPNSRSIELKVWDEPQPDAIYVLSADVAHGSNEDNDRSAFQVLRCYADGVDQVAEYAWPLIGTRPYAWVILAVAGWYAEQGADIYLIVELNGPGSAVWDEITYLKHHIAMGYQPRAIEERGLKNIFRNVKNYIYSRPDSLAAGKALQWKTTAGSGPSGKVRLMERCRDFFDNGMLHIRSWDTLDEMKKITRSGDTIGAEGKNKDDRVVSLALGIRCWEERVRRGLSSQQRTRANEAARKAASITDQSLLYSNHMLENFFSMQRAERRAQARVLSKARWRYR